MARINLLPWREQRRAELRRQFLLALCGALACGMALTLMMGWLLGGGIGRQQARNDYLGEQLAALDRQLEEIRALQRRHEQLLDRMRIVQERQVSRPLLGRMLDALARAAPDGVVYTELRGQDQAIEISGLAESSHGVPSLMRRLKASEWLGEPRLEDLRAAPAHSALAARFTVTVPTPAPAARAAGAER